MHVTASVKKIKKWKFDASSIGVKLFELITISQFVNL